MGKGGEGGECVVGSLGDCQVALTGVAGGLMFYMFKTEAFSKCVPQDTCSGEVPENKGL